MIQPSMERTATAPESVRVSPVGADVDVGLVLLVVGEAGGEASMSISVVVLAIVVGLCGVFVRCGVVVLGCGVAEGGSWSRGCRGFRVAEIECDASDAES